MAASHIHATARKEESLLRPHLPASACPPVHPHPPARARPPLPACPLALLSYYSHRRQRCGLGMSGVSAREFHDRKQANGQRWGAICVEWLLREVEKGSDSGLGGGRQGMHPGMRPALNMPLPHRETDLPAQSLEPNRGACRREWDAMCVRMVATLEVKKKGSEGGLGLGGGGCQGMHPGMPPALNTPLTTAPRNGILVKRKKAITKPLIGN